MVVFSVYIVIVCCTVIGLEFDEERSSHLCSRLCFHVVSQQHSALIITL